MKAVLKLVLTYFTGTQLLAIVTTLGLVGVFGGSAMFMYLPPLIASQGGAAHFSLAAEPFFMLTPVVGVIGVAFGASLLPSIFARLAASHYLYVLPYGRVKILASVFITLTLAALLAAGTTTVYYVRTPMQLDVVFERAFVVSLLTCNLLYVVLWLTGKSSSAISTLVGSIVMIATLVLPLRFIALPSESLIGPWAASFPIWGMLAAAFLLAPREKGAIGKLREAVASRLTGAAYHGGGEIDLLVGTGQPWQLALGQVRDGSPDARHRAQHPSRHADHGARRLARSSARGGRDAAIDGRRNVRIQARDTCDHGLRPRGRALGAYAPLAQHRATPLDEPRLDALPLRRPRARGGEAKEMKHSVHPAAFLGAAIAFCGLWLWLNPEDPRIETTSWTVAGQRRASTRQHLTDSCR